MIGNNKTILCVILARGGSKGVPQKNIKQLNGHPLIYYTIKSIVDANIFDRIILSTDSIDIASIAKQYDIEVPFLRPPELSDDESNAMDAVHHALEWIKSNDKVYDYVQYIFPTAPLRTSDDLLNGIETLLVNRADMVISVCKTDHPAQWMNTLPADKSLTGFVKPEYRNTNNQKLPQTYRINGAIYVAKWDIFYNKLDWMEQNTIAYIMPRERSVDIDTELDFRLAEVLMSMQDS